MKRSVLTGAVRFVPTAPVFKSLPVKFRKAMHPDDVREHLLNLVPLLVRNWAAQPTLQTRWERLVGDLYRHLDNPKMGVGYAGEYTFDQDFAEELARDFASTLEEVAMDYSGDEMIKQAEESLRHNILNTRTQHNRRIYDYPADPSRPKLPRSEPLKSLGMVKFKAIVPDPLEVEAALEDAGQQAVQFIMQGNPQRAYEILRVARLKTGLELPYVNENDVVWNIVHALEDRARLYFEQAETIPEFTNPQDAQQLVHNHLNEFAYRLLIGETPSITNTNRRVQPDIQRAQQNYAQETSRRSDREDEERMAAYDRERKRSQLRQRMRPAEDKDLSMNDEVSGGALVRPTEFVNRLHPRTERPKASRQAYVPAPHAVKGLKSLGMVKFRRKNMHPDDVAIMLRGLIPAFTDVFVRTPGGLDEKFRALVRTIWSHTNDPKTGTSFDYHVFSSAHNELSDLIWEIANTVQNRLYDADLLPTQGRWERGQLQQVRELVNGAITEDLNRYLVGVENPTLIDPETGQEHSMADTYLPGISDMVGDASRPKLPRSEPLKSLSMVKFKGRESRSKKALGDDPGFDPDVDILDVSSKSIEPSEDDAIDLIDLGFTPEEARNFFSDGDFSQTPETNKRSRVRLVGDGYEEARETLSVILEGTGLTEEDAPSLIGALDDSKVDIGSITKRSDHIGVDLDVQNPMIESQSRELLLYKNGVLICRNNKFFLKKEYRGTGIGLQIFSDQVRSMSSIGVDRIVTHAAGNSNDESMNGYYVWPRLGYDVDLETNWLEKLDNYAKKTLLKSGISPEEATVRAKKLVESNPQTVLDLMESEDGRMVWKEFGYGDWMKFDLNPGSRSLQVLNNYLVSKGKPPIEIDEESVNKLKEMRARSMAKLFGGGSKMLNRSLSIVKFRRK